MLEDERQQYQKTLREKQESFKDELNEHKSKIRPLKQMIVRYQMEKTGLTSELENLKADLN